jgi:hypothetical protein
MGALLKFLPLILKFQDVTEAVKDKSADGKPFYYTQRFWGAVSGVVFLVFGYMAVDVSKLGFTSDQLATNLDNLANAIGTIAGGVYSLALMIKGVVDSTKRTKTQQAADKGAAPTPNQKG